MLYDNAQLARVYLHSWQVTGRTLFRTVVEERLAPGGGFYSTQDADSEGVEGKFFVWMPDEIREVLDEEADAFMAAYGVTRHGNFEGKNIPELIGDLHQRPALSKARCRLFKGREKRVRPGRNEKVLTSWNGLMESLSGLRRALAPIDGFLEDYANLAESLLALYQATFDPRWYQAAHDLVDMALALFWVGGEGFSACTENAQLSCCRDTSPYLKR